MFVWTLWRDQWQEQKTLEKTQVGISDGEFSEFDAADGRMETLRIWRAKVKPRNMLLSQTIFFAVIYPQNRVPYGSHGLHTNMSRHNFSYTYK